MAHAFERIGIIGKFNALEAWETIGRVIEFFSQAGCTVYLDQVCCPDFPIERYPARQLPREELVRNIDLGVIVGGDGTLLNAARDLVEHDIPVLGINLGRLGFLVDFSPDTLEQSMQAVLAGDYEEECRSMLKVSVHENTQEVFHHLALNDVVVHKKDTPRMIEFDTWVDDHFMNRQRSDGLIVTSPTGSTAYALSAGGPIMDPRLDAMALVSINPHTLSNRPVVVPGSSVVKVVPSKTCTGSAKVTCDGQVTFEIFAQHITHVQTYEKRLRMIHPKGYNYYDILRTKLKWGS